MTTSTKIRFPNEAKEYRSARDELLSAELELRRHTESVAALRRQLPAGGRVTEQYVFEEPRSGNGADMSIAQVDFVDLFEGDKDTLVLYNFMFPPNGKPCPMCSSLLDALNGSVIHLTQRVNVAVAAKAKPQELHAWKRERGWSKLRVLSSGKNTYNLDYFGEVDGNQMPMLNVFRRTPRGIVHTYGTELLYTPPEEGQDPRHVDSIWPLWNVLDLTPDGRGSGWYPSLSY